jgi:hypothetical protein
MLGRRSIDKLSFAEKLKLIQQVGYGIPNMDRARYSANNSMSIIAQRSMKPFKIVAGSTKTDEFHLFELPWPVDVLQELLNVKVKIKVTLSYFIEPNPGNKQYEHAASYISHGLRFKMVDKNERKDAFLARVSKAMETEDYEPEGVDNWVLGDRLRNKGSIHKDIWMGPAVELAAKNLIAVHPVSGWWRTRKQLQRYDNEIFYSLIITIEAPDNIADLDIYTPVLNQINIDIPV